MSFSAQARLWTRTRSHLASPRYHTSPGTKFSERALGVMAARQCPGLALIGDYRKLRNAMAASEDRLRAS